MATFIVLAALALVLGVAAVAIPLLRTGAPDAAPPAPWAALGAAAVLVFGSLLLYAGWSNWSWSHAAEDPDSPQTMVAHLARRLELHPDNKEGWMMLGRSYGQLKLYPLSARAYERANRLDGGRNFEALMGEAEALIMDDDSNLGGRAGTLLEQALQLQPDSGEALFYGAVAAVQRGDLALAKGRYQKVLAMNPPDNVRQILLAQIAALDQRTAGGGPAAAGPAAATGPAVRVNVQLSPGVAKPDAGSPLFVFVADPARPGGMPLAVKKLDSHFPQTVVLTPQDTMTGQAFAAGQKVQVVARISRTGRPMAASGDPFGEVAYRVGTDGLVNITINQVTP
jgi:cytochrome c-type biogenesis protein CcmH